MMSIGEPWKERIELMTLFSFGAITPPSFALIPR